MSVNIPYVECLGMFSLLGGSNLNHSRIPHGTSARRRRAQITSSGNSSTSSEKLPNGKHVGPNEDRQNTDVSLVFLFNTPLSTKEKFNLRILKVESMQNLYQMVHMLLKKKC